MKKNFPVIFSFIFILNGCSSQTPDYLNTIAATELNQVMQNENIFLVDVHTPEQKHIKGTDTFVPFNQIKKYIDKFPQDKNTPIYLYCEGGARAWRNKGLALE